MPEQHDPSRGPSVAELRQKRAAEEAAHEAERAAHEAALRRRAVECRAITSVVANNPVRHGRWNAVVGRLLSRLSHK